MNSSSNTPLLEIEKNYHYLKKVLSLDVSNVLFEEFLSHDSFPTSYHLIGFSNSFVVFTYKGNSENNELKKYVSLVSKNNEIKDFISSILCNLEGMDSLKRRDLTRKLDKIY